MLYLTLTCIIVFAILFLSNRFFGEKALITVAIGSAIGANFYNNINYPFQAFGVLVSIEGCLFSLFIFCVAIAFNNYGKKSATTLLVTVMCAITFTAVLEFLALLANTGVLMLALTRFFSFAVNVLAVFVAGAVSIKLFDVFKKLPPLLNVLLFVLAANFIKMFVYVIYYLATNNSIHFTSWLISIAFALVFSFFSYTVISRFPHIDYSAKEVGLDR